MSLAILIVESDVEVLGDLSSRLRAFGLDVSIADSEHLALERARGHRPDVIVIERTLGESTSLVDKLASDPRFAEVPRVLIADGATGEDGVLDRRDAAGLARHLYAAVPRGEATGTREGDFRGDLSQVSVVDLLQLLSMNRRSGSLTVTTRRAAGEVRLQDGEVFDAVFHRQEGEKALFRLLGEEEGSFAFAGGGGKALRRIETPTSGLLMEGIRQLDEGRALRAELSDLEGEAVMAVGECPDDVSEAGRQVWSALNTAGTIEQLLDRVDHSDLDILRSVRELLRRELVRRVEHRHLRAELADAERLRVLAALVRRAARDEFAGTARLVIAGDERRLAAVGQALSLLAEASVPHETAPTVPVPHILATVTLPGDSKLEIVGLPLVDAYSPMWGLSLPGSMATICLEGAESQILRELTDVWGAPMIDAAELVGDLDESDPEHIAALLRGSLDHFSND